MNSFLIPANSKRGNLILNLFRPIDLIILLTGMLLTFLGFVMIDSDNINVIFACIPVGIAAFLVLPIPNYHNVLCVIQSIYSFYTNRRSYKWKGWCFYEQYCKDEKGK